MCDWQLATLPGAGAPIAPPPPAPQPSALAAALALPPGPHVLPEVRRDVVCGLGCDGACSLMCVSTSRRLCSRDPPAHVRSSLLATPPTTTQAARGAVITPKYAQ